MYSDNDSRGAYCPQCGLHHTHHDDSICGFRYYHDEINHERGWIPDYDAEEQAQD